MQYENEKILSSNILKVEFSYMPNKTVNVFLKDGDIREFAFTECKKSVASGQIKFWKSEKDSYNFVVFYKEDYLALQLTQDSFYQKYLDGKQGFSSYTDVTGLPTGSNNLTITGFMEGSFPAFQLGFSEGLLNEINEQTN